MNFEELPPNVQVLFRTLNAHGVVTRQIAQESATWEVWSGIRLGYFNSDTLRKKAVLGYQMVGLLRPNGSVSAEELDTVIAEFRNKYACGDGALLPDRQLKNGKLKGFLFIIDPTVALQVMLAESGVSDAEEAEIHQVGERLVEGRKSEYLGLRYERSAVARLKCIEKHGYVCACCGTQLSQVYRGLPREVIHVHHVRPLSSLTDEMLVHPESDLVPVCPNCHAVIHVKNPPYSVSEVQEMLNGSPDL